jgi:3-methyl-2-oxobutanoate hydroxymethyltransferase
MARRAKVTIRTLQARKREGPPISMLTCYDYSSARLMEEAGIDSLLVGDTYGEVCLGHGSTLPVTLDHLVTVAGGVRRGAPSAFLVGDMPYLSYQVSAASAIRSAGRFMAEAGCDCVKVEVDRRLLPIVDAMVTASLPVMAHLGLRPQWINSIGGYLAQGKKAQDAFRLIEDARLMVEAGAVAILLEAVPSRVAALITKSVTVPVIGIASGPECDGQVLVMHDMLGYTAGHPPPSAKVYANMHDRLVEAFRAYAAEVSEKAFPGDERGIVIEDVEWVRLQELLGGDARG